MIPQGLVGDEAKKDQAAYRLQSVAAGQAPGAHLRGFCLQRNPATKGAHEHLVIQVLTWLAQLPDPLPSGFCKEF